jgi:hypothetical protein
MYTLTSRIIFSDSLKKPCHEIFLSPAFQSNDFPGPLMRGSKLLSILLEFAKVYSIITMQLSILALVESMTLPWLK